MTKKEKQNQKRRQRYYNKEYDRLITHAKKLYNEMSLGGIFGSDLPSFEEILNWAGTKSGLKKPTKKSLQNLRKLRTERGILWGIEHTLDKKSPRYQENLEVLESLEEADDKMQIAMKKAQSDFNNQNKNLSKEERYEQSFDLLNPVKGLLTQLKHLENYFTEKGLYFSKKNTKYANEEVMFYDYARESVKRLIEEIEQVLNGGDMKAIEKLSQGCKNFIDSFPNGAEPEQFYKPEDGEVIRRHVFEKLNEQISIEEITPSEDQEDTPKEYSDFIYDDFF